MNVVVNGLMTNYRKAGSGKKTIVLLHGWGEGGETFTKLTENLKDKYTVLAPDLPGLGGTQAPENAWDLDDYAKFVSAWLKKLGVKEIYAFAGYSNGGAIAIRGVGLGILQPKKLVLLASSGIRDRHKIKRKLLKIISLTGKLATAPLPATAKQKIRQRFYARLGSDIDVFPQMETTFRQIVSQDVQGDASVIKLPTLLIYGTADTSTPALFGEIFQQEIKGSELEIVDGAGHFLHQEQPAEIAKLITNFLEFRP